MLVDAKGSTWERLGFASEAELENVVKKNFRHLFGDQSLYFGESEIKTSDGHGTRPDGFVIRLDEERWYIVEAELARHGVYSHIVPQVTKQISASREPRSRSYLRQCFINEIKSNKGMLDQFAEAGIPEIDVDRTIERILDKDPIVAIPIDEIPADLSFWASSLKYEVQIIEIKRYENKQTNQVMIELPDPEEKDVQPKPTWEPDVADSPLEGPPLVRALIEHGFLREGQKLLMSYKGHEFHAFVHRTGYLTLPNGDSHPVSVAAVKCMQKITPARRTHNGWYIWRTEEGRYMNDLRQAYRDSRVQKSA